MNLMYIHQMDYLLMYVTETCTAPKKRGGGGAEDDVNLNTVAEAVTALKSFRAAARPLRPSPNKRRGATAPPGGRLMIPG